MSIKTFDDECAGCRPMLLDLKTKKPLGDDSPEMAVVNRIWSQTTRAERESWHRFTCQNSRATGDIVLAKAFSDRLQAAFDAGRKDS